MERVLLEVEMFRGRDLVTLNVRDANQLTALFECAFSVN